MRYTKSSGITGGWVDKSSLTSGTTAKIVSETTRQESAFTDDNGKVKMQDVAKVKFEGEPEAVNVPLNRATLNGLIDAFGEESAEWQGHTLTVEVEKSRFGGKAGYSLFLIPDGYEKVDDAEGFAVIQRKPIEA